MPPMSPRTLRVALEEVALTTENLQGLPADLAATRHDLSTEVRRYLTPRLVDGVESLVVAITGPSGVGKSALLNDLVGETVTKEGAIRPTTTTPVTVTGVARDASNALGAGSSLRRPRLHDAPVLQNLTMIDMPAAAPVGRIRPADVALVVTSPQRYADAAVWSLINTLEELGVTVWIAMNRSRGRGDEVVEDLRTLAKDVGIEAPVYAVSDRGLVGQHQTDAGLIELRNALMDAGTEAEEAAWSSVLRRTHRLGDIARLFAGAAVEYVDERGRLEAAVMSGFAQVGREAESILNGSELAAAADAEWRETASALSARFSTSAATAAASVAAEWRQSEVGSALLETHDGRNLASLPEASQHHMRDQLIAWRDELARNVRAKLRRNPRQSKIDELIDSVRIQALGGEAKLGWLAKRRLATSADDLAKDARRRLKQTLGQLGDHDGARFMKQLGPGPTLEEVGHLQAAVEQLDGVLRSDRG